MLKPEVIIIACAFQQIIHILSNNNEQRNVDELGVTVEVTGASYSRFFQMLRTSSTRACANQCTFAICLSHDSAWLSKQLKNRSSRPRASEAADRGKHAFPDGELQIAENPLEGEASLRSQ